MKYNFSGLDSQNVEQSRIKHGSNKLSQREVEGFWEKFKDNSLGDPMIRILIVALVINVTFSMFGYAEWYEGLGIAIAVIIAASVATLSEYKSDQAFQKLLEEASHVTNKVFRNGKLIEVTADDIVVGDYVLLQPGDKIPADGAVVTGELKVIQAALNGEPNDVLKCVREEKNIPLSKTSTDLNDPYTLFRGAVVSDGEAVMLVERVGEQTEYGKIFKELALEDERSGPLKVKLESLADGIGKFGMIGGVFIALAFMFKKAVMDNNFDWNQIQAYLWPNWQLVVNDVVTAVILAVIIIVVAVPEGLPMMIATVLSINSRKLYNDNVLVLKDVGIETAGSLNILFTDKTGTITKGHLESVLFMSGETKQYKSFESVPDKLGSLLTLALKYNNSCALNFESSCCEIIGGNPTEKALLKFVEPSLNSESEVLMVNEICFNSARKFSATQIKGEHNLTLVKGAPEVLLGLCKHYYDDKGSKVELKDLSTLDKAIAKQSEKAIRVVAVAISEDSINDNAELPASLTLVGIVGIRDEIRAESTPAIRDAHKAGIQVVMITGDKKETAVAIAKDVGLLTNKNDIVLTSSEINEMSDEQLRIILPNLRVVARALPSDKTRLVEVAQSLDLVVGMTGDGVNDAPALKKADVGFAMGSGTEVAKEAGEIQILDDNFQSITKAVLYGRTIFNAIRKFIVFQLTVNVSAISVAFLGPFLGFDFPLTMVQLLWVNVVMDSLAALAFGGEAALSKYMEEKPKKRNEKIISPDMWSSILANGFFITVLSIIFLKNSFIYNQFGSELAFMTGFFAFFIFLNNFNKFNARTDEINLFSNILINPGFLSVVTLIFVIQIIMTYVGGEVLRTVGLSINEWIFVVALSILIIPFDLTRKFLRNAFSTPGQTPAIDVRKAGMEQAAALEDDSKEIK